MAEGGTLLLLFSPKRFISAMYPPSHAKLSGQGYSLCADAGLCSLRGASSEEARPREETVNKWPLCAPRAVQTQLLCVHFHGRTRAADQPGGARHGHGIFAPASPKPSPWLDFAQIATPRWASPSAKGRLTSRSIHVRLVITKGNHIILSLAKATCQLLA